MEESLVFLFDSICVSYGDQDCILFPEQSICYYEIQELSRSLAQQLLYRYRPDYVLIDCFGHVAAEAVSLLACMRIQKPFVPVSVTEQHTDLSAVVEQLKMHGTDNIVTICCCEDDQDPALGVFYQADIHRILFVDKSGNLHEQLHVPSHLPPPNNTAQDELYILFTSGTSGGVPKAVVGSHLSTYRRLQWFRDTFEPASRIARRTKLTFVDSISELLGCLMHPPSVLVAAEPDRLQTEGIAALIELEPTQITLLPSQLSQLLLLPSLSSLKRVIVSGEVCPESLLDRFRKQLPDCQLINLYGQTESSGDILCAVLTDLGDRAVVDGIVAVGTPILPHIQIKLADNQLTVTGNLSHGYLGQPELLEFPTGDVGFCKDGIWYVKGRQGDTEKINGILTSPAEVEATFSKVYKVDSVVAATIVDGIVCVVSEDKVPSFSRQGMHQAGIPWNLIPRCVFCHSLPVARTGAGKIDRTGLKRLVRGLIAGVTATRSDTPTRPDLVSLIKEILKVPIVQETQSFVELGGDSVSAVTLLYELRLAGYVATNLTAADILLSDSVKELNDIVQGKSRSKRRRMLPLSPPIFVPQPVKRYSDFHFAVQFSACVDATTVISGSSLYVGCQGGVIQKIAVLSGEVEAYRHFAGRMIQASCVLVPDAVVVCAYSRSGRSLVASLSRNLQTVVWQHELDGTVKSTPVLVDDFLLIASDDNVHIFEAATGTIKASIKLPSAPVARPAIDTDSSKNPLVVYASPEWDIGLVGLECGEHAFRDSPIVCSESIGPVHKDLSCLPGGHAIIADSCGFLHKIQVAGSEMSSIKVSDHPLSSPVVSDDGRTIVGSYDGMVRCLSNGARKPEWVFDAGAVVYATPLLLSNGSCVVCTTAGDVIQIRNGREIWRTRLAAEIWGEPVVLEGLGNRIVFGARDSRLHFVTMHGQSRYCMA